MLGFSSVACDFEFVRSSSNPTKSDKMKSLLILFAIVAVVAAFPEPERERRGILAGPALASPWIGSKIAAAPIAIATGPKLLAAPAVVAAPALGSAWGLKGW